MKILGNEISTMVTSSTEEVGQWIKEVTVNFGEGGRIIAGLDIIEVNTSIKQFALADHYLENNKFARVDHYGWIVLCIENRCLAYQPTGTVPYIPPSLLDFLADDNNVFGGSGISPDRITGYGVKNYRDLRFVKKGQVEMSSDIKKVTQELFGEDMTRSDEVIPENWDGENLTEAQLAYETEFAYKCFLLGKQLLKEK